MILEGCRKIAKLHRYPDRCLPLRWSEQAAGEFPVLVKVQVLNERGVLAILALAVSDADANIEDINVEERETAHYMVMFKLTVRDRAHLARVLRRLRQMKQVVKIMHRA